MAEISLELLFCDSKLGEIEGGCEKKEEEKEEGIVLPVGQNKQRKKILIQEIDDGNSSRKKTVKKENSFAKNLQVAFSERKNISKESCTVNTDEVKLRYDETLLTEVSTKRY